MKDELLESIIQRLKNLHQQALSQFGDEELLAALAMYRSRQFAGRVLSFEEAALVHLIRAVQKVRNCPPIEPGESPFDYRK